MKRVNITIYSLHFPGKVWYICTVFHLTFSDSQLKNKNQLINQWLQQQKHSSNSSVEE